MDGEQEVSTPSNDQVANTNTEVTQEPAQQTEAQPEADKAVTPNGYEGSGYVDFSPEQLKRVNALTKKASTAEKRATEAMDVLKQQSELINELRNSQSQVITHLQNTNFSDAEAQLKTQRKQAYDRGDLDAVDAANDRLNEIKLQKLIQDKTSKAPIVQAKQPIIHADPVEVAVQNGAISRNDAEAYDAWVNETDKNGNLVRPWTNEHDPRNISAAAEGKAVFSNPSYQNKPFADKLKEIDKRMGVASQQSGQGVLPAGNLTRGGKNSNIKLSPWAETIAVKTKFAGPGKSRDDHIEAYRKQIAETRGSRQ